MIANLKDALWLWRMARQHGKILLFDPPKWEQKAEKSCIIRWTLERLRKQGRAMDLAIEGGEWTPPV